jgi:D-glycero-D-manno-heptose 1,7-bisphosphate phosphatase
MVTIDKSWTLFLDRDGVINDNSKFYYIKNRKEFIFKKNSLDTIEKLSEIFPRIFIVTNQQGIGKGVMTAEDLNDIHMFMLEEICKNRGRIDKIYFCPHLAEENCSCRKPKTGLALQAKSDYPEIDFSKSVMIGDSERDMIFGNSLGMTTFFVNNNNNPQVECSYRIIDFADVIKYLKKH